MTDNPWKCAGCGSVSIDRERTCECPTGCLYRREGERTVSVWKTDHSGPPPSAKDYAAQIVAAKFTGRRQRLSLLPHELASLIALAYDAGVLAQQRFTETPKG